jgi:hypothetical protein
MEHAMPNYCSEITEAMRACRQLHLQCKAAPPKTPEYWKAYWAGKNMAAHGDELRKNAAKEFAALNGWRYSERGFAIKTLARGGTHETREEWLWRLNPICLLDHSVYFREIPKPYRPVTIVGQPYESATSMDRGIELARSLGLELHAPPNSVASWWYPGYTQFFCLTRPGVEVRFLPDQLTFEARSPRDSDAELSKNGGSDEILSRTN